jgi:hypothetical protein
MATQRRSTEAIGDALMRRWFQERGGEIGVRVGETNNGVLSLHLLSGHRAAEGRWSRGGREVAAVRHQ